MNKRAIVAAVAVTAGWIGAGAASAGASDHNQQSCEAAGGTWSSERGVKTCLLVEVDEGKNPRFECTTTEETSGRGNLGNKTEGPFVDEEEQGTGSGKCPPGQYN